MKRFYIIGFLILMSFDTLSQISFKYASTQALPLELSPDWLMRLFLNPWLYSTGKSALTDIKSGNNSIKCNGETAGFEAIEGWDPVTGLGTPDFKKLLKAVGL